MSNPNVSLTAPHQLSQASSPPPTPLVHDTAFVQTVHLQCSAPHDTAPQADHPVKRHGQEEEWLRIHSSLKTVFQSRFGDLVAQNATLRSEIDQLQQRLADITQLHTAMGARLS
ncbi:hypothetical protein BWQ96_04708 [Gracilariopsis chorda]|uniref:Uncharacterized protein n=1 Tax=Gracilariopsis chorda TaxID=448386 RepID=A0A2V3ITQ0_9FLOR|nr:hypothetical protein BWQ96_04708 [Gracilariopsis chorda]|eukprot:PXF45506.1 hypothetical protein BWQ96_04708 [Gracilariopsis chorda]